MMTERQNQVATERSGDAAAPERLCAVTRQTLDPKDLIRFVLSPDGTVVPPGAVKLDPEMLELVPRSSRGVSASVDGAALVAPGRYRGLLLADGADEVAVPVELTVANQS